MLDGGYQSVVENSRVGCISLLDIGYMHQTIRKRRISMPDTTHILSVGHDTWQWRGSWKVPTLSPIPRLEGGFWFWSGPGTEGGIKLRIMTILDFLVFSFSLSYFFFPYFPWKERKYSNISSRIAQRASEWGVLEPLRLIKWQWSSKQEIPQLRGQ